MFSRYDLKIRPFDFKVYNLQFDSIQLLQFDLMKPAVYLKIARLSRVYEHPTRRILLDIENDKVV